MEFDPHTLQLILQRIYQQMRCPQCGKKIPVDFSSLRVAAGNMVLLQLKCEDCNAHIVLQASLQGLEHVTAPPYEENRTINASSGFVADKDDIEKLRKALSEAGGSFKDFFNKGTT